MATYYLDIETTGLNPQTDKIITIQYQELRRGTGNPAVGLTIRKEWESSEREMLKRFLSEPAVSDPYPFAFIPVGYNLNFEHKFLEERAILHGLNPPNILDRPFIDLRAIGIIMNGGEFKGSGLDRITGKPTDGRQIPIWYRNQEYEKIIEYVVAETREFIRFNAWLHEELPLLHEKFRGECGLRINPPRVGRLRTQAPFIPGVSPAVSGDGIQ